MCQNYPVPTHLIDKACPSAAPRQARGQGDFAPSPSLSLG